MNSNVLVSELNSYREYHFAVIFSMYKNKWLFCRHKDRREFETAGGHIENGETPLQAAKRELYEETGAVKYNIKPLFDYRIGTANGQVFFAEISKLEELPKFEMVEIKLFDTIPSEIRFPQLLPLLFEKVIKIINL